MRQKKKKRSMNIIFREKLGGSIKKSAAVFPWLVYEGRLKSS